MTPPVVQFFFDCSSPWSYIAFERIIPMAARLGFAIQWRPVVVGGVFNRINPGFAAGRIQVPAKATYAVKDIGDWAKETGLKLKFPPNVFPVNSVAAMRMCLAADGFGQVESVGRTLFQTYFAADEDLANPATLARAISGFDQADAILDLADSPDIKAMLIETGEDLIRRGGFGVPTAFFGDDMYFGADRLWLLGKAVQAHASCEPEAFQGRADVSQ